jgi:hypothetical protein
MTVSKSPGIHRLCWTIEESGPTIEYNKGPPNAIADALSRLDTKVSSITASLKRIAVKQEYKLNDHILLDRGMLQHKGSPKQDGPYQIV